MAKRSCQTHNPCEIYRTKLISGKKWSAAMFPCRFSPGKIKNPSASRGFCLQPNVDNDYFGSYAVVTEPEFSLRLVSASSRSRQCAWGPSPASRAEATSRTKSWLATGSQPFSRSGQSGISSPVAAPPFSGITHHFDGGGAGSGGDAFHFGQPPFLP